MQYLSSLFIFAMSYHRTCVQCICQLPKCKIMQHKVYKRKLLKKSKTSSKSFAKMRFLTMFLNNLVSKALTQKHQRLLHYTEVK